MGLASSFSRFFHDFALPVRRLNTAIRSGIEKLPVGRDDAILLKRHEIYQKARENKPSRWSGTTRKWKKKVIVRLNWLKDDPACDRNARILSVSCFLSDIYPEIFRLRTPSSQQCPG